MTSDTPARRLDWRSPWLVIAAGCAISTIGFGVRSSLGLFLEPMTVAQDWTRETFGLALAIQNLFWGLCLPFAGALADRHGAARVIAGGGLLYALGIFGMSIATSPLALHLFAGVLAGTGIAFSAFSLALAAMVRVVDPSRRSVILGAGTAAGSFGQVLFSPLAQGFIALTGWADALVWLALITLVLLPLSFVLPRNASTQGPNMFEQSLSEALGEAMRHRGFVLLSLGFFVCGFHVAFITVHFPAWISDAGLAPSVGAWAIALIGLFNIAGSMLSGVVGRYVPMRYGLSAIYLARAIAITILMLVPTTPVVVFVFAAVMGLLWLSTVPLTTGIVAQVFGPRYMATLFGIVFLSHQIGSFLGVWLGGLLYDATGSYDVMWWAGVGFGVLAMLLHLPIDERPLERTSALPSGA